MTDLLLDTDVIIDHIRGARPLPMRSKGAAYSALTRAELYAGARAVDSVIEPILSPLLEIPFAGEIADEAGRIRRDTGLGMVDAGIAATAILTGRHLLTRNVKDFRRVKGLSLARAAG